MQVHIVCRTQLWQWAHVNSQEITMMLSVMIPLNFEEEFHKLKFVALSNTM